MTKHVFDLSETAPHNLVAAQLHALADQIAKGAVDLSYDEWQGPTAIVDPVDLVIDMKQKKRHVELTIDMRWRLAGNGAPRLA
ncbi:MAG: amphi-Trp domain-containing protein [Actinomycetota bacterium]